MSGEMVAPEAASGSIIKTLLIALGIPIFLFGGGYLLLFFTSGTRADMLLCDAAIEAGLAAPATYRRVTGAGPWDYRSTIYEITYDADNSFGVPLRGKGWCNLDENHTRATWTENTLPSESVAGAPATSPEGPLATSAAQAASMAADEAASAASQAAAVADEASAAPSSEPMDGE